MTKKRFAEILTRRLKDYQINYLCDRVVRHDITVHDVYAIALSEHGYPQSAE